MSSLKIKQSTRKDLADAQPVAVGDLYLDPKNPRLVGGDYSVSDQAEIVRKLWEEFNVGEIVDSILASNSFWKHEPLIAARENGKLIVVEGNRRLAAVKILLDPEPLIKSQNPDLRILNEVLLSDRGISALKRQSSLQSALNAARGDETLLLDALVAAEQNLRDAKAYFSTGYRGQDQVVLTVKNIKLLADSLGDELEAKKAK